MSQKWDSIKIRHEDYQNLIVLKSRAEERSKKNVSIAEVVHLIVSDYLELLRKREVDFINIQGGY